MRIPESQCVCACASLAVSTVPLPGSSPRADPPRTRPQVHSPCTVRISHLAVGRSWPVLPLSPARDFLPPASPTWSHPRRAASPRGRSRWRIQGSRQARRQTEGCPRFVRIRPHPWL
ncbi:hypothetical protein GY45DRAFT_1013003 [Cubamyces sp. BRFM 1775]|nr:hypothetical protein GY45DRAFT_1013003 [Cubamyces sp. BRFM 1775]